MSNAVVKDPNGHSNAIDVRNVICRNCGTRIAPDYLCLYGSYLFCRCPVHNCGSLFILRRLPIEDVFVPNAPVSKVDFSKIIDEVSHDFVVIYNEAYAAEQMSLSDICGVGYRKALEFLIKDYVTKDKDGDEVVDIRKTALAKCIDKYVKNDRIKEVAKRAVWLGNDETHYVRKWEGKDVNDLKGIIHLTVLWIEQEIATDRLLKEMQ